MTNHDHSLHTHGDVPEDRGAKTFLRRGRWIFWIFAIIAAWFLITEHRAHVLGALPYLILAACPLMHMFMHGGHGHGGHGGHGGHDAPANQGPPAQSPRDGRK